MAYYESVLRPDEKVQFIGHLHWQVFNRGLLLLAGAILAWIVSGAVAQHDLKLVFLAIAGVAGLVALVVLGLAALERAGTEIVVTDKRVIYKAGLISRTTVEMNISKIETVDVRQGLLGRLLGFGTVIIRGTGAGFEPLRRIADPVQLRNAILVG